MADLILLLLATLAAGERSHATEHFVIRTGDEGGLAATGALLEATRERFYRAFEDAGFELGRPGGRLEWIRLGDGRELAEHALRTDGVDMSWTHAYYSARTGRVVFHGADDESLVHEAAHQLAFHSGLQTRGVVYPLWASEGLAAWLEERGRLEELRRAGREGRLVPIEEFLTLVRAPRAADRSARYAQAWAVFGMLIDERPESLRRYYDLLRPAPAGPRGRDAMRREIASSLGPIESLAASWRRRLAAAGAVRAAPAVP